MKILRSAFASRAGLQVTALGLLITSLGASPLAVVADTAPAPAMAMPMPAATAKSPYPTMAPIQQYHEASDAREIALAKSAAPASISDKAEIKILGARGY